MILKWFFDRIAAFLGLAVLWPVFVIVAILIRVKMPGGPAVFVQKSEVKQGCDAFVSIGEDVIFHQEIKKVRGFFFE